MTWMKCQSCGRTWHGQTTAHCAVCCCTFADMAAHGAHIGPDGCRSTGELAARGLVVEHGVWTWRHT